MTAKDALFQLDTATIQLQQINLTLSLVLELLQQESEPHDTIPEAMSGQILFRKMGQYIESLFLLAQEYGERHQEIREAVNALYKSP